MSHRVPLKAKGCSIDDSDLALKDPMDDDVFSLKLFL